MPVSPANRGTPDRTQKTPQRPRPTPSGVPLFAVDFGTGKALCVHGPDGPVDVKSLKLRRSTPRDEFTSLVTALLELGNVVFENTTIGSSGAELQDVRDVIEKRTNKLHNVYTVSKHAVKNHRKDHGLPTPSGDAEHADSARIIYTIGSELDVEGRPRRMKIWREKIPITRKHVTVRPMDKRGYDDEQARQLMCYLPPYEQLPPEIRASPIGLNGNYRRCFAIPFAQAIDEIRERILIGESGLRSLFLRIIGLTDQGHSCHYRRVFNSDWVQENAKTLACVSSMTEVSRYTRKQAQKKTTWQIRRLFHLCVRWLNGTYPSQEELNPPETPPPPKRLR